MIKKFVQVAVPTPLRRLFSYQNSCKIGQDQIGSRVSVPFGRQQLTGIVVSLSDQPPDTAGRIKNIDALLDSQALWPADLWSMLNWAAAYYQHPLGDVFATALPALLRQGRAATYARQISWSLSQQALQFDLQELKRAPKQRAIIQALRDAGGELTAEVLREIHPACNDALNRLHEKNLVQKCERSDEPTTTVTKAQPGPELNNEQQAAVTAINKANNQYQSFLLEGVTGSGKTEVYLHAIESCLARQQQALVLIPEIGLTPQMIRRFQQRLPCQVGVLHSGLTDSERLHAWLAARDAKFGVVLGTRSAIFTPLKSLGLIIIDEEHDASFKQQEGFRYSARDLAIWRAHHNQIPIVLGSATPSLESLENINRKRHTLLTLSERAGGACPPQMHLLDMRSQPVQEGLSDRLVQLIGQHLEREQQVLLFLNRRGFSPTLMCHDCGWIAHCARCDTNMTYHHSDQRLRCHHCGSERRAETQCQQCESQNLLTVGTGTERVETALKERFSDVEIIRIDRDTTRKKGSLQDLIERVRKGKRQILIGTQMLAKGHHFPNVTLVGIIDADQGLHSPEFRAPERMAQLILQVAGRAGRAEQPGEVYIQTHHPDHPLLQTLIHSGYNAFATALLAERRETALPPYSAMALFRAEATSRQPPLEFLQQVKDILQSRPRQNLMILGPLPAPMEKRAGRYRAQLVISASQRSDLQTLLQHSIGQIDELKSNKVRWSLDVDPIDTY